MGGPRAGADTQSLGTSTSSAGSAERLSLPGRRCLAPLAVYLLAGAALFTVYLRLSETSAPNSDSVVPFSAVLAARVLVRTAQRGTAQGKESAR